MAPRHALRITWAASVSAVNSEDWNSLARPLATPFLEYEWLSLLERSGSVCPETGWDPQYLLVSRDSRLVAACPLYRKTHSEGEFVFDYMWTEAAGKMGIRYFPKLVGMSPVTPVEAFQFLIHPEENREEMTEYLCRLIVERARELGLGGIHFQYVDPAWGAFLTRHGFTGWEHPCYLWTNPGYDSFEGFLSRFSKNTRRNIRREEASVAGQGITVHVLTGEDIDPGWHALMHRYYLNTNEKFGYWAALYLTGDFFRGLFREFRHRLALAAAFRVGETQPLAMALFLTKHDRLWGRYWGGRTFVPHLHFNVCYYAPFRWAIAHGIRYFDPGIGAEHKARRGFVARPVVSLHRFVDPRLDRLFRANVDTLNAYTRHAIAELNAGKKPEGW